MKIKVISVFVISLLAISGFSAFAPTDINPSAGSASAACITTAPPTTFGQVKQTVNVATAGTYRVWSRIKAPNTTANSYYFQVDTGCHYNVGDAASIPVNTWTWVNYQDATTAAVINVTLTAGSHTLTYTGKEADVQLDKVMLLTDLVCVPTGTGENCAGTDLTSPTASITSPSAGATVSGTVTVAANASDLGGISKVDFLADGTVVGTDTTAAYSAPWNTTTLSNGSHTLTVKAYDTAGNVGTSSSVNVSVNNVTPTPTPSPTPAPDKTAPTVSITAPTSGSSVSVGTTVTVNANAADNVGVTKVEILVGGSVKTTDTSSPYTYAWPTTGLTAGAYAITAKAYDAAGNVTTSTAVTINLTSPGIPGDVNKDSRVNALDLSSLISHDGQNYSAADFNGDGTVGAADMAILLSKWTW